MQHFLDIHFSVCKNITLILHESYVYWTVRHLDS